MDQTDDQDLFATKRETASDLLQGIARESVRSKLFGETSPRLLGDRYKVLRRIGQGGMGAVYLALDTRLERNVAIKVLHAGASEHDRPRLIREALLMARVPSVHVVPVHDVGHDAGQAFVAMEYVPGPSLRKWWTQQERTWQEVLAVVMEAGRGLAAAHAAGVVHRDFKPDNVLIDADGRARVVDFGLASVGAVELEITEGADSISRSGEDASLETLTRTGEVVGTPRYMAPEQFAATAPGEAADQFALCVTLYEGLYRERPFAGDTITALAESVLAGEVREPVAKNDVPGWLWPVIRRGLEVDPADRHPSVAALLAALQKDPAARRRRVVATVGLLGAGAAAATAVLFFANAKSEKPCVLDGDRFADVWDPTTRDAIGAAFDRSGRPHAPDTLTRVTTQVDAWTAQWREQWTSACEATARKEQSETVLDLRMACLERARVSLAAATSLLRDPPEAKVIDNAIDLVAALPRLDRCADAEALSAAYPPPESVEAQAEAVEITAGLATVHALWDAGAYAAARGELGPWLARAHTLAHPPLLAEALYIEGSLLRSVESEDVAEPVLREAAAVAATAHDDALVVRSILKLMNVARAKGEYDKARELGSVAEISIARAGNTAEHVGSLANERGMLARAEADFETAGAQFEVARKNWTEVYGEESADVAAATLNVGAVENELGHFDAAEKLCAQALATLERVLGPTHPRLSPALSRLGQIAEQRGHFDEARAYYERVLAIDIATYGPEDQEVAYTLMDLGSLAQNEGDCPKAIEFYERAGKIWTERFGAEHPNHVAIDSNLGACLYEAGELEKAREHHQRALDLAERTMPADHPMIGGILSNLGVVAEAEGKHAEARSYHERALAQRKAKLGEDHPETLNSLRNLAFVSVHEKKWDEAQALYTKALDGLVAAIGREHEDVAVTHRELARIAVAKHDGVGARSHFEQAIEIYVAIGDEESATKLREELAKVR